MLEIGPLTPILGFTPIDPTLIGKGAETIVRDRGTGLKVDVKLERLKQREAEAKKIEEEEKYLKWGKVCWSTHEEGRDRWDHGREVPLVGKGVLGNA